MKIEVLFWRPVRYFRYSSVTLSLRYLLALSFSALSSEKGESNFLILSFIWLRIVFGCVHQRYEHMVYCPVSLMQFVMVNPPSGKLCSQSERTSVCRVCNLWRNGLRTVMKLLFCCYEHSRWIQPRFMYRRTTDRGKPTFSFLNIFVTSESERVNRS